MEIQYFKTTQSEKEMYALWKKSDNKALYTETWCFQIETDVCIEQLKKSINILFEKYRSFNTNFTYHNGEILKFYNPKNCVIKSLNYEYIELSSLITQLKNESFNLNNDSLIKFYIYTNSSEKNFLLINSHHILTDSITKHNILTNIFDYDFKQKTSISENFNTYIEENLEPQLKDYIDYLDFTNKLPNRLNDYSTIQKQYTGLTRNIYLGEIQNLRIKEICKNYRITPFALYLGIFYKFLSKMNGSQPVTIGIPFSNRSIKDQNKIGYFVNTIPFAIDYQKGASNADYFRNIQSQIFNISKFKNIHLSSLNGIEINPIKIIFSYQESEKINGIAKELNVSQVGAKFDLTINMKRLNSDLFLEIEYSNEVWTEEECDYLSEVMEDWFLNSFNNMGDIDNVEIKSVKYEVLEGPNKITKFNNIFDLLEHNSINKQKPAIIHNQNIYSYYDLINRVEFFAEKIKCANLSSHSVVALLLNRSFDALALVFALAKEEITHVHMSNLYSEERTNYIFQDSQADIIICENNDKNHYDIPKFTINDLVENNISINNVHKDYKKNIFSLIYTSGTTGKPKGSKIQQTNIINLALNNKTFDITSDDYFTHASSYTFDAWYFEVFVPLLNNSTVVIINNPISDSRNWDFANLTVTPTVSFLTTSLFNSFVQNSIIHNFSKNRKIVIGGEAANVKFVNDAIEALPHTEIINGYGPTENTTFTSIFHIKNYLPKDSIIPIGQPLCNVKIIVTDKCNRILPKNCYGEILISGNNLMQGYLNSNKGFVDIEINGHIYTFYKTGDIGKIGNDNLLYYKCRKDRQVKLRGYRIELSDIEQKVLNIDGVSKCVVQLEKKNQSGYLILYYEGSITPKDLKIVSSNLLPSYMVPNKFVKLTEIKLTLNGKIDRESIQNAQVSEIESIASEEMSENEKVIHTIIKDLLKLNNLNLYDDFYSLGIDSITSLQVCAILKNNGFNVNISDFFKYQNIKQLALHIKKTDKINKQNIEYTYWKKNRLSAIQKWFFQTQEKSHYNHWNQSITLRINTNDNYKIKNLLIQLINQYPILSSKFKNQDGNWYQEVQHQKKQSYNIITKIKDKHDTEKYIIENQKNINIEKNVYSFLILKSDVDVTVHLAIHHLIIDGISWRTILKTLEDLIINKKSNVFEIKRYNDWVDYPQDSDLSIKVNEYIDNMNFEESKKITTLMKDIHYQTLDLDQDITNKFKTLIKNNFMNDVESVLLGLTINSLKPLFGDKHSWTIMMEGHGRSLNNNDFSNTIGWFTTIYPIKIKNENSLNKTILHAKNSITNVPEKGHNFLNYFSKDIYSDFTFNYLGEFEQYDKHAFEVIDMFRIDDLHEEAFTNYNLQIVPIVQDSKLKIRIYYSHLKFTEQNIKEVIQKINSNIESMIEDSQQIILPISGLKEGMLLQSYHNYQQEGNYTIQWHSKFDKLDINRLLNAVSKLIEIVPALRSTFTFIEDNAYEFIKTSQEINTLFKLTLLNWNKLKYTSLNDVLDRYLFNQTKIPFDIQNGPLFRITVIETSKESILIFEFHHLILDGWSMSELFYKLSKLYENEYINFNDLYVQTRLKKENEKKYIDFNKWNEELKDYNIIDFPVFETNTQRLNKTINIPIDNKIKKILISEQITLNELILMAWIKTISEYFGKDDILLGITMSGRNSFNIDELNTIGMFITTLPLRIKQFQKISEFDNFKNIIQSKMINLKQNDQLSWFDISKHFNLPTLIQIGYVYENYPVHKENFIFSLNNFIGKEQVEFPIALSVTEKSNSLALQLTTISKHFDLISINEVFDLLINNISQISNKNIVSKNNNIFTKETIQDKTDSCDLRTILTKKMNKYSKVGFIFTDKKNYLYSEIINIVTNIIERFSLSSRDTIIIYTNNRLRSTVTALACFLSGATYVPVSKDFNEERIKFIIKDSKANCIFDEDGNFSRFNDLVSNDEQDLAYIIYTSGSTGTPKGVKITRNNLKNLLLSLSKFFFFDEKSKHYQNISMTFDPSIMDILLPIFHGASIFISDEKLLGCELEKYIQNHNITSLTLTPSNLRTLKIEDDTTLVKLLVGGEQLFSQDLENIPKKIEIINMYGPTEVTITSSIFIINETNRDKYERYPIGKILENINYTILSKDNLNIPKRYRGELILSGTQVAKGYTDATKTSQYFKKLSENQTIYSTGDIVFEDLEGNLNFVSRKDRQIKLRGYRIEMEEIENTIIKIKPIKKFHLFLSNEKSNLTLYYIGSISENEVKEIMHRKLPSYMVPTLIKSVDEFPLTSNGKIDEVKLLKLGKQPEKKKISQNYIYNTIETIFLKTLSLSTISPTENFFEIGGNSLYAIKVVREINNELNINLSISLFFEIPTISELVKTIETGDVNGK